MVSDPEVDFAHCVHKEVNFLSPNRNIGLPIFSIHGNHDDASGGLKYSVMNELHENKLINYFGRYNALISNSKFINKDIN